MNLKSSISISLLATILFAPYSSTVAEMYIVNSLIEFEKALRTVQPNDTIIWGNGTYNDVNLVMGKNDIFFLAETPGKVMFTGGSTLVVKGDGNIISGFQFLGGKIEGDVVDISGNNNTIEHINIHSYDSHYYLRVRPNCQYNRISYCNFEAKPESQESSVVQIEATEGLPGYHIISHCAFKNHTAPPGSGADYGIEALRIGYSYQRMFVSRTIVEYCYFEKCNGDYEIISCKARENIMRYNTFINNGPAHLTLRHGSKNLVYGNFFIDGAGVRIKEGQDHAVINNYFDTGEYLAIQLQNHHFDPVDSVTILYNTFISGSSIQLGGTGDYPPKNVLIANNLFSSAIDKIVEDPTNTEQWFNNVLKVSIDLTIPGFQTLSFDFHRNDNGLFEPLIEANYEVFKNFRVYNIPELDDDSEISYDIMKQKREGRLASFPGAYLTTGNLSLHYYATPENTGPNYLK